MHALHHFWNRLFLYITVFHFCVQDMEHHVKSLEEQQDEFDFKYKTHNLEGRNPGV